MDGVGAVRVLALDCCWGKEGDDQGEGSTGSHPKPPAHCPQALAFPDQLYDAVFDGAQVTSKTPIRLYGGALLSEYCWADAWKVMSNCGGTMEGEGNLGGLSFLCAGAPLPLQLPSLSLLGVCYHLAATGGASPVVWGCSYPSSETKHLLNACCVQCSTRALG